MFIYIRIEYTGKGSKQVKMSSEPRQVNLGQLGLRQSMTLDF